MAPPKKPWFRWYVEAIHDVKLRTRPPAERWLWVAILSMARSSPEPGRLAVAMGVPATTEVIADAANLPTGEVETGLAYFKQVQMLEQDCDTWVVKNFDKRQYESDTSAARVAQHRSNGDVTAIGGTDVTAMKRSASVSVSLSSVDASSKKGQDDFARFWAVYPLRVGKEAARKALVKALEVTPLDDIIAGAERYRNDPNRDEQYTAHPTTWLNQGRWSDDPLPSRRKGGQEPRPPVSDRNRDRIRSRMDRFRVASDAPPGLSAPQLPAGGAK